MIKIDIFDNLDDIQADINQIVKAIPISNRRALQRTGKAMQRLAHDITKKNYRLNSTTVGAPSLAYFKTRLSSLLIRTGSNSIDRQSVSFAIKKRSITKIGFIRGKRTAVSTKGVAVKKRRKLRASVRPGRTTTLKHSFIINTRNGPQVMVRNQGRLRTLKIRSPHKLFLAGRAPLQLEARTRERYVSEFNKQMNQTLRMQAGRRTRMKKR